MNDPVRLNRLELAFARNAARGRALIILNVVIQAFVVVWGVLFTLIAWREPERGLFHAVVGGMGIGGGLVNVLGFPALTALGKLFHSPVARAAAEGAPVADERASSMRQGGILLAVIGSLTVAFALWRFAGPSELPAWMGVAMGASGGAAVATGVLMAAWVRGSRS